MITVIREGGSRAALDRIAQRVKTGGKTIAASLGLLGLALIEALASAPQAAGTEEALLQICSEKRAQAVPLLALRLQDPRPQVRRRAAWTLSELRLGSAAPIPTLISACADPDDTVRHCASVALQAIGEPAVIDPSIKAEMAAALRRVGEEP